MLVTEAKEQLLLRFQSGIWQIVVPLSENSLDTAPSGALKFDTVEMGSKFSFVLEALQGGVQKLFQGRAHNVSFWAEQMSRIVFKLSGALVDTCRVHEGSYLRECEIKEALLSPLLGAIAHSASILPGSDGVEFTTHFFIEQPVEARVGMPGRKPEVHYIIRGEDMQGHILYAIPTEAKVQTSFDDSKQLASYMCKLMKARDIAPTVLVGLLIDQEDVRLAFSAFSQGGLALPLTVIGPSMKWRNGVLLVQPTCCALALMYLFSMGRVAITRDQLKELFSNDEIIMKIAKKIASKPFCLKAAQPCSTLDLSEVLLKYNEQKEEIQVLKAEVSRLKSQMAAMQDNARKRESQVTQQEETKRQKTE